MRRRLAVGALLLAPLLTAGCAVVLLPHQRSGTVATPSALAMAWSTPASEPAWLPRDSHDIRFVASTEGGADRAPAALLVASGSALPRSCAADDHPVAAAISASWAPSTPMGPVHRCGGWAVVAVRGGWYGWTPVAPAAA